MTSRKEFSTTWRKHFEVLVTTINSTVFRKIPNDPTGKVRREKV